MESGVEVKSGSGSIDNSKKQRSLDLQTLYKSRDSSKGKVSAEESDVRKKKKKRKSVQQVSLDKTEAGPSVKKRRSSSVDENHVNGDSAGPVESRLSLSSSGLEKRLDYSNGLTGFAVSLDSNGNAIQIPKRPRGTMARKKFDSGRALLLSKVQTPVIGNGKVKGEPEKTEEGDQLPKKQALSGGEAKSDEQNSNSPSSLAGNGVNVKVKRQVTVDESQAKKKDRASSVRQAKGNGHVAVNNGEASSKKHRSSRNRRNDSLSRSRKSVKNGVPSRDNFGRFCQESVDDDDEENLEQNAARMLSSRFDPSCTGFSSKSRSLSADRLSSLQTPGQDFVSCEGNYLAGSESASVDNANRVLRPRQRLKERGASRKRRHFYEVLPRDLDAYWVLNRRIKIFWPLDESWYYGLLNDYDPERKLHHVKYDDREEEWINLENERFKLLLLPGEVPGKKKARKSAKVTKSSDKRKLDLAVDDDSHPGNCLDSEPIISWLARSSHRVKSSPSRPLKKQKTLQLSSPVVSSPLHAKTEGTNWNVGSLNSSEGKPDFDLLFPDKLTDLSKAENSFVECRTKDRKPVVYVRRRFRKKRGGVLNVHETDKAHGVDVATLSDVPDVDGSQIRDTNKCIHGPESEKLLLAVHDEGRRFHMPLLEAKQFRVEICLPILPLFMLEAEQVWLSRTVLLLQHGAIMTRQPKVILEMLFVDNAVGLRFLLFECFLNHAVAFIFLVLTLFNQADEEWGFESLQLPVTSVRFRLSSVQDARKQQSFAFYCFSKLKNSKWLYLDSKLQKHSLLAKQLPLSECTYENLKSLDSRSEQLQVNAHVEPSSFKKKLVPGCLPRGTSTECSSARLTNSTFSSAVMLGRIPPFALSFAAAPTFFICLHLKLLMERNFACVSLQDYDSISACQPAKDDASQVKFSEIAENIAETSCTGASSATSFAERQLRSLVCEQQLGSRHVSLKSSQNCQLEVCPSSFTAKHPESDTSDVIVVSNKLESDDQELDQCVASSRRRNANDISHSLSNAQPHSGLVGMSVVIPSFDQVEARSDGKGNILGEASQLTLNTSDDMISSRNLTVTSNAVQSPHITGTSVRMVQSPNPPSGPRGLLYHNRNSASSSPFGESSPVWVDGKTNFAHSGFGNGPKKPRTQVQYTQTYGGYDFGAMHKNHSPRALPYKRIRRANEKKNADNCSGLQRNIEFLACDANVLVTLGDKGWREFGAQIVLEIAGHNEWRIAVKFSGVTKYSYKVQNVLQPGSTNRFTHAMMWKGGKDWVLEFPDRSQWMLFKELHEECYNRNIRAASVKNIPIPGVRLIEEIEDYTLEISFIRPSPKYYRQVESDVDMAMDPSRIMYDMDSEDEQWLSKNNFPCSDESKCGEISEELFEKTMDMFEKIAYARQRDHFALDELEELMVGVGSMEAVKSIYELWQNKRQKKGMALIRHLQPPLWERYQQLLKDWEQAMSNANLGSARACHEKAASLEKPVISAFCLKPRGLEVPNKGSKQRSQKKISVSGHSHAVSRDQDVLHPYGRRLNGYAHGDEVVLYQSHEYSDGSPMLHASPRIFSPREASGYGYFSLNSDVSDWNHQPRFSRNKPKRIGSFHSPSNPHMVASYDQRTIVKRNGVHRWNNMGLPEWPSQKHYSEGSRGLAIEQFDSSDLHEFRLRDASGAAQHALNMAKLKRENAQRLLYRADVAIHKAAVALMTAEAIKAAAENTNV